VALSREVHSTTKVWIERGGLVISTLAWHPNPVWQLINALVHDHDRDLAAGIQESREWNGSMMVVRKCWRSVVKERSGKGFSGLSGSGNVPLALHFDNLIPGFSSHTQRRPHP